jgi:hydrogenase maturation protease
MPSEGRHRFLVVGLGNLLLADDGVGVHAVRRLAEDPPPGALVVEVGTAILDALHLLEGAERVLAIDAVQAGGAPGTVYLSGLNEMAQPGVALSLHELDIRTAVRMMGSGKELQVAVVGVEPQTIDYGMELTEPVAAALPSVEREVRRIVSEWSAME